MTTVILCQTLPTDQSDAQTAPCIDYFTSTNTYRETPEKRTLKRPTSIQPTPADAAFPTEKNLTQARILRPPPDPPKRLGAGTGWTSTNCVPFFENQCSACGTCSAECHRPSKAVSKQTLTGNLVLWQVGKCRSVDEV
jgi:hypothetical protein